MRKEAIGQANFGELFKSLMVGAGKLSDRQVDVYNLCEELHASGVGQIGL
jgi:hypothetical protein